MVPIKGEWTPFADKNDQLEHYRQWGLIPPKAKKFRPIMVVDGYFDAPEPCNVVGYQGDNWAVIELTDGFHAIYGEYLAELQPVAYQKLPSGVCFVQILSKYVVLDIETTGFDHRHDRVIEIAAAHYEYGKKIAEYHSMVNPGKLIPPDVVALTGITQEDVKNAPALEDIENSFLDFISDMPIIGHNALAFDVPFLSAQLSVPIENCIIDTLPMAKKVFELLPRHGLEYLNQVLQLDSAGPHRALNDVETTNALLWACMAPRKYETLVVNEYLDQKLNNKSGKSSTQHIHKAIQPSKAQVSERPKVHFPKIDIKTITPSEGCDDYSTPLSGKSLVFTGELSISREDAMQMAVDAGADLKTAVSSRTSYLVVGRQDKKLVGSDGMSTKEEKAHELNKAGKANIQILTEQQFVDLTKDRHFCSMEQLSMEPEVDEEKKAFELLYPEIQDVLYNAPIDSGILIFKKLENFSSVYFMDANELFIRIRIRKKTRYILIPEMYEDLLPSSASISRRKADIGMIRIEIQSCEDILKYVEVLRAVLERICRNHREFGCCSRYLECSDAKCCIHPDPKFALTCWYRYNLLDGKIFYGKNKNA